MRKINILHIIGSMNVGGAEKSLLLLLQNIDRSRFNPVVVTMYSEGIYDFFYQDFKQLNIPLYHLHLRSWRDLKTFYELKDIIRMHRIDITHSHCGNLEFFGTLYARLAGVRHCIYTKHNMRVKTGFTFHLERVLLNCILTERILSISQTVTEHLVTNEYSPRNRIRLVYNPIENPHILNSDQIFRQKREWKILPKRFIIGNTSRFDPFKGFDIFYLTLRKLVDARLPVYGIVLGDENNRINHKRLIERYHLKEYISIIPFQKDLSNIYSLLDYYLFPSINEEGFGMALLEAMSYGLPVVGLNVGVMAEIICDKYNGLLPFPKKWVKTYDGTCEEAAQALANSIAELTSNSALRQKISKNARKTAKKFSTANFTKKIEDIYFELMQ
ncbi:MAG TPA: glycosyltransferase [Candidatus Marinimicrobia bacterium]|nr:glycosyltransferase [Candidatus Neomarinimicrobiota bacterium]HRS51465.1 glycosyltransferase [Candidatus Neomarinimicrobiota bacterium]HRU92735.1 glycosyltransferase [Candidatus Neomarinimicrobiota bacterium]